ncbi:methyltransferase domain-containing protein [Marispirochaeta sp.]|uniref:methyltransferase domain-containing protein n=1 Tax=Marispirochaeta sp. TaxID=2038653 RepID=UPI0029C651C4|nr:methyltransferase domain-containing protein [Marispirochaeta sp.]
MLTAIFALGAVLVYISVSNFISYRILKKRILASASWDLNICCGKTDGGGINADIVRHAEVPNFIQIDDIYRLPFRDKQFQRVLCSHTMEHVDDPEAFIRELKRVGEEITIVIPPLYDISAALNIFEHKWIFLSFRKRHYSLPRFVRLPLALRIQKRWGQLLRA